MSKVPENVVSARDHSPESRTHVTPIAWSFRALFSRFGSRRYVSLIIRLGAFGDDGGAVTNHMVLHALGLMCRKGMCDDRDRTVLGERGGTVKS